VSSSVVVSVLHDLVDISFAHPRPIEHRDDDDFGHSGRWPAGRGGEEACEKVDDEDGRGS